MSDQPWQPPSVAGRAPVAEPTPPGRARASRWERPKPPHDWRWVVGGLGRTLIAVGLLIFGFVAYQLWGTGIQTARAQASLSDDFDALLEGTTTLAVPPTSTAPTQVGPTPGTAPVVSPPPTTPPGDTAASTAPAPTSLPAAAATTAAGTIAPAAAIQPRPEGEVLARIDIPAIGVEDLMMVEGVSRDALTRGPGHFPESVLPGQLGNAAVAGHRTTYGAPFGDLDGLAPGDEIVVTTLAGTYVYGVTEKVVVEPSDYVLVVPTFDASVASLTLVTCDPPATATKRLVVRARLDAARSAAVTPTSATIAPATAALPEEPLGGEAAGDPPTVSAPAAATSASSPEPTGTGAPSTSASPEALPDDVADPSDDAFGGGWFEDRDAIPHVAAWGVALTVIALGAYALSRRSRSNWVGALAGFVPFAIGLYFWFENVNRLLPAGI